MGMEGRITQNYCFLGKRHDNIILKVQILLSRNFVVFAYALFNEAPHQQCSEEEKPPEKNPPKIKKFV